MQPADRYTSLSYARFHATCRGRLLRLAPGDNVAVATVDLPAGASARTPTSARRLLVSLGCESFNRRGLADTVRQTGRKVETLVIQQTGGTRATIRDGRACVERALAELQDTPRCPLDVADVVVGTICGGSDATSGLTANLPT